MYNFLCRLDLPDNRICLCGNKIPVGRIWNQLAKKIKITIFQAKADTRRTDHFAIHLFSWENMAVDPCLWQFFLHDPVINPCYQTGRLFPYIPVFNPHGSRDFLKYRKIQKCMSPNHSRLFF